MVRRAQTNATYDDILALPENVVGELIAGELHVQPRPAYRHATAASGLGMLLGPPFHYGRGGPGGWIILFEPELHLGADVLVPDLAGWRRQPGKDAELDTAFQTVAPDWICEILSPSTRVLDRARKLPLYASHRVGHAWLIDPVDRTLEVFRLQDDHWMLIATHDGEAIVRAEPFEAIELALVDLWPRE